MKVQTNAASPPLAAGAQTAADLASHLDRVRLHRSELGESLAAVVLALEAPVARGGMWRERVRAALAELAHDFEDHIALTEGPGGLYERLRHDAPRLSGPVDRLAAEHRELHEAVHGYLAVLEHGGTLADLPIFREELTVLVGRFVRHRQRGGDLVYEAYDVDLGGSD